MLIPGAKLLTSLLLNLTMQLVQGHHMDNASTATHGQAVLTVCFSSVCLCCFYGCAAVSNSMHSREMQEGSQRQQAVQMVRTLTMALLL